MSSGEAAQHRGVRALVLILAAVILLASCGKDDNGTLRWTGDTHVGGDGADFGIGQSDLPVGDLVAFGAITLCVDGPGQATIQSLQFKKTDHIKILRYAVRTTKFTASGGGLGGSKAGILAEGFTQNSHIVTTRCHKDDAPGGEVTELGMDFAADAPGSATGKTLLVGYQLGSRKGTVEIPATITLCSYPQDRCHMI
jgi:hypothetical protein